MSENQNVYLVSYILCAQEIEKEKRERERLTRR